MHHGPAQVRDLQPWIPGRKTKKTPSIAKTKRLFWYVFSIAPGKGRFPIVSNPWWSIFVIHVSCMFSSMFPPCWSILPMMDHTNMAQKWKLPCCVIWICPSCFPHDYVCMLPTITQPLQICFPPRFPPCRLPMDSWRQAVYVPADDLTDPAPVRCSARGLQENAGWSGWLLVLSSYIYVYIYIYIYIYIYR